jgi:hypothetical protein
MDSILPHFLEEFRWLFDILVPPGTGRVISENKNVIEEKCKYFNKSFIGRLLRFW